MLLTKLVGLALLLMPALILDGAKMTEAKGGFDIEMAPGAPLDGVAEVARLDMQKRYHGDLEASGKGVFLSAGDPKQGNAGYVAIERVTGTLAGRAGSFALMQSGQMSTGTVPQLTVTVVPGSGTGELSGIYGGMTIENQGGKHSYDLAYGFAVK